MTSFIAHIVCLHMKNSQQNLKCFFFPKKISIIAKYTDVLKGKFNYKLAQFFHICDFNILQH